jgi:hypothetical protein
VKISSNTVIQYKLMALIYALLVIGDVNGDN